MSRGDGIQRIFAFRAGIHRSVLLGTAVALVACAGSKSAPEQSPAPDAAPRVQAEMAPVPDFRRYVVGDLPSPPVPRRDPFAGQSIPPPVEPAPVRTTDPRPTSTQGLELRGIVQSNGRYVALLNTSSVSTGDHLAGWVVVSIDARQVILEKNGRRKILTL